MPKKVTVSSLTKDLDKVFSRFVRLSHADDQGIVECYTCPFKGHWKRMQAGHYVSRYYLKTRWDERNVRPQCYVCNIQKKGAAVIFRSNLAEEIGEPQVAEIEEAAKELKRGGVSVDFLSAKIEEYTQKTQEIHRGLLV